MLSLQDTDESNPNVRRWQTGNFVASFANRVLRHTGGNIEPVLPLDGNRLQGYRFFETANQHISPGADPEHSAYNSFADLKDPDGNTWVLQERR